MYTVKYQSEIIFHTEELYTGNLMEKHLKFAMFPFLLTSHYNTKSTQSLIHRQSLKKFLLNLILLCHFILHTI